MGTPPSTRQSVPEQHSEAGLRIRQGRYAWEAKVVGIGYVYYLSSMLYGMVSWLIRWRSRFGA